MVVDSNIMNPEMNSISLYLCVELECTSSKHCFFPAPGNHPNRCPSLSYTSRHPTSTRWVPMPKVEQPTPPGQRESPTRSKDPWPRGLGLHGECNRAFLEFGSLENFGVYPKKNWFTSREWWILFQDFSSPSTGTPHRRKLPVLAPSATPAVLSAKVATVETPKMEPKSAAMASAK